MKTLLGILWVASAAMASEVPTEVPANCRVNVGFGSLSPGGRCFSGEVMTGIRSMDPLQIYCSRITVDCPRDEEQTAAENKEPMS